MINEDNVIYIKDQKRSALERRAEIRRMIRRAVKGTVVDLKTFRQLKNMEKMLTIKVKAEEQEANKKKPKGSGGPKGVA